MKRGVPVRHEKGQATGLIILGIVILAIVILVFYLRGQFLFGPAVPRDINERLDALADHVTSCITDVAPSHIERLGLQGGYLRTPEDTYRLHNDVPISYLCYDIPNNPRCANRMLTKTIMAEELNTAIFQDLPTCLQLQKFRGRGVDLTIGTMSVYTDIGDDTVIVTLNMPATLASGAATAQEDSFVTRFAYPLGRLYKVSQDIIGVETEFGDFEQLSYMLAHRGQYLIDKKKPYPDKLYILRTKDSDYAFQFFVQDEPST